MHLDLIQIIWIIFHGIFQHRCHDYPGSNGVALMRNLFYSHNRLFVRDIMVALLIMYVAPMPKVINPAQLATFTTQVELFAEAVAAFKSNRWNNLESK